MVVGRRNEMYRIRKILRPGLFALAPALVLAVTGCNTSTQALNTSGFESDEAQNQEVPLEGAATEQASENNDAEKPAETAAKAETETKPDAEATAETQTETAKVFHKASTVTQRGTYIRALVNGQPITNFDIQRRVKFRQLRRMNASKDAAMDELIEQSVKVQEAKRISALATNPEVDRAFANFAQRNKTNPAKVSSDLNRMGVGAQHFKEYIRSQISWNRVIGAKLRSENAGAGANKAIFELRKAGEEKPETTEYQLQQIIFVIPQDKKSKLTKARRSEALNFKQRFTGCSDSIEMAKTLKDVAVKNLGRMMEPELPPEWKEDITSTPTGQTTNPKVTDKGVEVLAVCNSKITSDDRAVEIINRAQTFEALGQQGSSAGDDYLQKLKKQATIVYR